MNFSALINLNKNVIRRDKQHLLQSNDQIHNLSQMKTIKKTFQRRGQNLMTDSCIITDSAADFSAAELKQLRLTAVPLQVIFGEDARVISEENGEIALLLPAVSGTAHEEDLERLVACGARILSSIPVYE